ncbi:MAG TPA: phosphoglycerate mutase family protein [Actinomycetes bacterium]|jgi:phosphohistidine phosphatase SixA|nr:phosphoglycerate mutase family protein [Actinomycetes bacterium]
MLLLVRHAHAGDKAAWKGADALRPLSPTGRAEAEGLVVRLEDYPVERILTSPALRCHQTVQPLARDRRLPIERSDALDRDASAADLLELVQRPPARATVLCTHGEAFGRLLPSLLARGLSPTAPLQWPKGCAWLLERIDGRLARAHYLPPLALADRHLPAGCQRGADVAQ